MKTCNLIEKILSKGHYDTLITVGTSKGGSSAIIYGLKFNAKFIFSGANQYHIGDYLSVDAHKEILNGMRGDAPRSEIINKLNETLPTVIKENEGCNSVVHLIYSKKEHTYEEHIVDLIKCLKQNKIEIIEKEYDFVNHNDVGYYFLKYIKEWFKQSYTSK